MQDATAILDAFERLGWKNNDPMAVSYTHLTLPTKA